VSAPSLTWRTAEPCDADAVVAAIDAWWPGLHMVHAVCPQLFQHFGDTCLVVEDDGRLVGFLVGMMSQRMPDAGYVHYAGVHPDYRGRGLGREMYQRFAAVTRARGRGELFAETGAWNTRSIAFHKALGFVLTPGDETVDGVPVHRDTTGHGFDYVEMVWRLDDPEAPS
jgi:ribosomal protein S18 acetylase RimI-like enzyme